MADLLDFGGVRVLTSNAAPGAGYVARFYESGTTTPRIVYTDATLGTPHGTSVTADASGFVAAVWSTGGAIKCTWETPAGAVVQTIDPVISVSGSASGAEDITFTPTVALPFSNVQEAIEGAAASAASGFATYGIGITGNATLLANMDATNIGAGLYRFDNTTTGTFPTGVAAADTGLVEHWRQSAATAMQVLYHATTDRVFHRRMAASTWGTWREVITSNQAPVEGDILYRGASAWTRLAKGAAGQVLAMNSGATAPEWSSGKRFAAANINTRTQPTGTYSQSGTTITVTMAAHGMTTGQGVYLDFTSGTAVDAFFQITVTDANTFTVTASSLTTSGNVTRKLWARAYSGISSLVPSATSTVTVTFSSTQADANYLVNGLVSTDSSSQIPIFVVLESAPPTTTGFTFTSQWEQGSGGGSDVAEWAWFTCDRI